MTDLVKFEKGEIRYLGLDHSAERDFMDRVAALRFTAEEVAEISRLFLQLHETGFSPTNFENLDEFGSRVRALEFALAKAIAGYEELGGVMARLPLTGEQGVEDGSESKS